MFCRNCGNQLKEGAAFCNKCGTKIQVTGSASAAPKPASQPVVTTPAQAPQPEVRNPEKKSGNVIAIVLVILALILAIGGVAGGLMYAMGIGPFESSIDYEDEEDDKDEDKKKDEEEDEASATEESGAVEEEPVEEEVREFIIPDSDSRLLTEADLAGLSAPELSIARNEIYARHGYIFTKTPQWNDYFLQFAWYVQVDTEVTLSDIEQKNAAFILDYQKKNGLEWTFE